MIRFAMISRTYIGLPNVMKGMARAIKGFAHRSGCIVIERCTWEKRKKIGHWAAPLVSQAGARPVSLSPAPDSGPLSVMAKM
jgi:hypothetical protein